LLSRVAEGLSTNPQGQPRLLSHAQTPETQCCGWQTWYLSAICGGRAGRVGRGDCVSPPRLANVAPAAVAKRSIWTAIGRRRRPEALALAHLLASAGCPRRLGMSAGTRRCSGSGLTRMKRARAVTGVALVHAGAAEGHIKTLEDSAWLGGRRLAGLAAAA
jgi:hypothetical protein